MSLRLIIDRVRFEEHAENVGAKIQTFNKNRFFIYKGEAVIFFPPVDGIRRQDMDSLKKYIQKQLKNE